MSSSDDEDAHRPTVKARPNPDVFRKGQKSDVALKDLSVAAERLAAASKTWQDTWDVPRCGYGTCGHRFHRSSSTGCAVLGVQHELTVLRRIGEGHLAMYETNLIWRDLQEGDVSCQVASSCPPCRGEGSARDHHAGTWYAILMRVRQWSVAVLQLAHCFKLPSMPPVCSSNAAPLASPVNAQTTA